MPVSDLPLYRTQLSGGTLSRHHRSTMQRVTLQVFPLRANMSQLSGFIDSYLNFVDDYELPPFHFRPAMPYVLMLLINYPRLAVTSENLSALSQHEISFSVPLECYAIEGDELIFKQFATCTPFLYLDQQLTIISGRDLFGLPKISLQFEKVDPPAGPNEQITMSSMSLRQPGKFCDDYVDLIQLSRPTRRSSAPVPT